MMVQMNFINVCQRVQDNAKSRTTFEPSEKALYSEISDCQS